MEENKNSLEIIKAILSTISLAVLAIQHIVGLFADNISISYIPLLITFLTIFVNNIGEKDRKAIKWFSLSGAIILGGTGIIMNMINNYKIILNETIINNYNNFMYTAIATISMILAILYIRRICILCSPK